MPAPSTTFDPTTDATGLPGSGSAKSVTTFAGNTIALTQCIAVTPGNYTLSGKVFIPGGQASMGQGYIGVTWFESSSTCSGGPVLGFTTLPVFTTGAFVKVSAPLVAPPGTSYAFVNAQHIAPSMHVMYFDDIVLDGGIPSSVPAQGTFALIALTLTLALAGVMALRR